MAGSSNNNIPKLESSSTLNTINIPKMCGMKKYDLLSTFEKLINVSKNLNNIKQEISSDPEPTFMCYCSIQKNSEYFHQRFLKEIKRMHFISIYNVFFETAAKYKLLSSDQELYVSLFNEVIELVNSQGTNFNTHLLTPEFVCSVMESLCNMNSHFVAYIVTNLCDDSREEVKCDYINCCSITSKKLADVSIICKCEDEH